MSFFNIFGRNDYTDEDLYKNWQQVKDVEMQLEGGVGISPQAQSVWFSQQDNAQYGPLNPATPEETAMKRESDRIKSNDEQIIANIGPKLDEIDASYAKTEAPAFPQPPASQAQSAPFEFQGLSLSTNAPAASTLFRSAPASQAKAPTDKAAWDRQAALDYEARYGHVRNEEDRVRLGMERAQAMRDRQMAYSNAPTAMLSEEALEMRAASRFGSLKLRAEARSKIDQLQSQTPRMPQVSLGLYGDVSGFEAKADPKQFGKATRSFMSQIAKRSSEVSKITSKEELENFGNTLEGAGDPKNKAALVNALTETLKYSRPDLYAEIATTRQVEQVNNASMADWYRVQINPDDKRTNSEIAAEIRANKDGEFDRFKSQVGKLQGRRGEDIYMTPPELKININSEQASMPYTKVITNASGNQEAVQTTYGDEIASLKEKRLAIEAMRPDDPRKPVELQENKAKFEKIIADMNRNTKAINVQLKTPTGSKSVLSNPEATKSAKRAAMDNIGKNLGKENSGYIYNDNVVQAEPDINAAVSASGLVKPGAGTAVVSRVSHASIVQSMVNGLKEELSGKVLNQEQINAAMTSVVARVLKDNSGSLAAFDNETAANFVSDRIDEAKQEFAKQSAPAIEDADKKAYDINFAAPANKAIQSARALVIEPDKTFDSAFNVLKNDPVVMSDDPIDLGLAYFEANQSGFGELADQIREGDKSILQREEFSALKQAVVAVGDRLLQAKNRYGAQEMDKYRTQLKDNTDKYGDPYRITQGAKMPFEQSKQWLSGLPKDSIGAPWSTPTDANSNVSKGRVFHNPILKQAADMLYTTYDEKTANEIINNLMPSSGDGVVGGSMTPDNMRIIAAHGQSLELAGVSNYDLSVQGATLNYKDVEDQSVLEASQALDDLVKEKIKKADGQTVSRDSNLVELPKNKLLAEALKNDPTLLGMWQKSIANRDGAMAKTTLRFARQRVLAGAQAEYFASNETTINNGIRLAQDIRNGSINVEELKDDEIWPLLVTYGATKAAVERMNKEFKNLSELSPSGNNFQELVSNGKEAVDSLDLLIGAEKKIRAERVAQKAMDVVFGPLPVSMSKAERERWEKAEAQGYVETTTMPDGTKRQRIRV